MTCGFIYLWRDKKRKKFYLGSHIGTIDDGYTGSGSFFRKAYLKRPYDFKRRILKFYENIEQKELINEENKWLSLIKPEELGKKYYNLKKVAAGGNIISFLSTEKKQKHKEKSIAVRQKGRKLWFDKLSKEEKSQRAKHARSFVKNTNRLFTHKNATIIFPNSYIMIVNCVASFCRDNNLNYGNMKTVLRGNGKTKSCSGYKGSYNEAF